MECGQAEGIKAKKLRGDWDGYGRPRMMDIKKFALYYRRVLSGRIRPTQLMKELNLTTPTYYRYVRQIKGDTELFYLARGEGDNV